MKRLLILALLVLSAPVFASNYNESGPGPIQDHSCQGGHNCSTTSQGGHNEQGQTQDQDQSQAQGQSQSSENNNTNLNLNENTNLNSNENTNISLSNANSYAEGGAGGQGGAGGSAYQGQSQSSDNSNSGNNSAQATSVNVTTQASRTWRYSNNVAAVAPNIYSSSACTAGGLTGAASALGVGVSLGGAKQDPQCQIRENARILAGLNTDLAIEYLCKNPGIDVGAVLGSACQPPAVVADPIADPPVVVPPIIITDPVKG